MKVKQMRSVCCWSLYLFHSLSLSLFSFGPPPLFPFFIHVASRLVIVGKWSVA